MNKVLLGAVMAALGLAACGGGSSNGITPQPVATQTPIVQATQTPGARVEYDWQGALAPGGGTTIQSLRRTLSASASPIPVQATLCDPRSDDCRTGSAQQYFGGDTNPTIDLTDSASPAPTAAPTVSPPPGQAVALQHSNAPIFTYRVQTPTQAGCGNMGVNFPNASGTVRLCVYPTFTIGCLPSLSSQPGGGYDTSVAGGYSFDTHSYTTDVASSDAYMTGQTCPGVFQDTTAPVALYTLHFPYGATALSPIDYSIATSDPSLWKNDFTSLPLDADPYGTTLCAGDLSCMVMFKTKAGNVVVAQFVRTETGADGNPLDTPPYSGDWFTAAYSIAAGGSFAH